jgi:chemotaxis protein methyltransferase CheR
VGASTATEDYQRFCKFLEQSCGITLGDNKDYLVRSRLGGLLQQFYNGSLNELVHALERGVGASDRTRIIDAMTTNETLWFRDDHPFENLKETVFPLLSKGRATPVRIWCAACSSGQEPYSISMAVSEYQDANPGTFAGGVEILGTDISPTMLTTARAGRYDRIAIGRGLSSERQQRFFTADDQHLKIREEIARRVSFKALNLLHSFGGLGQFDIVFCRNVLIFFVRHQTPDPRENRQATATAWAFFPRCLRVHRQLLDRIRTATRSAWRLLPAQIDSYVRHFPRRRDVRSRNLCRMR